MLLLHNTIPQICFLVEKNIPPVQEFWPIYPRDAWLLSTAAESCSAAGNPISQARDPILRPRDPIPMAPAGAESHFAGVIKLLVWTHMKMILPKNLGRRSNLRLCRFWHPEAPFEVSKTFSAHINLRSHSGIGDNGTFVLYTQSILLINWKQVAPKYL